MKSNIQMPLVLDGAMGTELLKLGLKLPLPLWSAIANEEHYKKVSAKDVELLNTLRNDTRTWQNDMAKLRAIFDEGCDTRPKLVERYKVWGV